MGGTRLARTRIAELKKKIAHAQEKKKEFSDFLRDLKSSYHRGEISYAKFLETFYQKRNGLSIAEWIEHFDDFSKKCKKEILKEKFLIYKTQLTFVFIFAVFISIIAVPMFLLQPKFLGFTIDDGFQRESQTVSEEINETIEEIQEEIPTEEIISEEITENLSNSEELNEAVQNESSPSHQIGQEQESPRTSENETVEEIAEENTTEIIEGGTPIENETQIEIPINDTEIFVNETFANETILTNITNETLIENVTYLGNAEIRTVQFQAVLNNPVKWRKTISSEEVGVLKIALPENAENIVVNKTDEKVERDVTSETTITGGVIGGQEGNFIYRFLKNILGRMTGNVVAEEEIFVYTEVEVEIDDSTVNYEIEYETPAPTALEEETNFGKRIKVSSPDDVHYQDVLAFTTLKENLNVRNPNKIKIKWIENDSYIVPAFVEDKDGNGIYDYVEWFVPHLSNQTFEIIVITKAEHLDENYTFISDIYNDVFELDGVWSEEISDRHYVRVVFEKKLTLENDITIYPRIVSGDPRIEVYENGGTQIIAEFSNITENSYNKVYLTNLISEYQDTFDLRITGGSLEFDHIVDPTITLLNATGAVDVNLAPLDNTTFAITYINRSTNSVVFEIWNTSGTRETGPITVSSVGINQIVSRVSIAAINRTSFFIGWTNTTGANTSEFRAGYRRDGTNYTNLTKWAGDGSIGSRAHDIDLFSLGTNRIGYCYTDLVEGDTEVRMYDARTGAQINGSITVESLDVNTDSTGPTFMANLSESIDCVAINESAFAVFGYDHLGASENDSTYHIVTISSLNAIVEAVTDADIDANVGTWDAGGSPQVALTTVDDENTGNETFVMFWSNNTPANGGGARMAIRYRNNTLVRGTMHVTSMGTLLSHKIDAATVRNRDTNQDNYVLAWVNSTGNLTVQIYNRTGNVTVPLFSLERVLNTAATQYQRTISLAGKESSRANGTSLCTGTWAIAYTNMSNATVVRTYWYNGSVWDGTCETPSDVVNPDVNITFPSNLTISNDTNLEINYTRSDNSAISLCWYSNDTYTVNTTLASCANITGVTWSYGLHNVTIYVNDTVGNLNFSTRSFTIDSARPEVNITFPFSNNTNTTDILLDINFTSFDLIGIDSCWYGNDTMSVTNKSLGSGGTCVNITNITWSNKKHNVTIFVNDTSGNINYSTISFTVDTAAPGLNITNPSMNNSNNSNVNLAINFSFFDVGVGIIDSCWYSNDTYSVNLSLGSGGTCIFNLSNITWSQGNHNFTVWVNDSLGNVNQSSKSFTIDTTFPSIFYSSNIVNLSNLSMFNYLYPDVNASDDNLANITVFLHNSTGAVRVNTSTSSPFGIRYNDLGDGSYLLNISAGDYSGNVNWTPQITFYVDRLREPVVSIYLPENGTTYETSSIDLDWSADLATFNCTYSLNNAANVSICSSSIINVANKSLGASLRPLDITWNGSSLFILDGTADTVIEYNVSGDKTGFNFTVAPQATDSRAVTWNGSHFYVINNGALYEYNSTGNYTGVQIGLSAQNPSPHGVVWYKGYFYVTEINNAEIYRYSPAGGQQILQGDVSSLQPDIRGITVYKDHFFIADGLGTVHVWNASLNTTGQSFSTGLGYYGLAFTNDSLFIVQNISNLSRYRLNFTRNTTISGLSNGAYNLTVYARYPGNATAGMHGPLGVHTVSFNIDVPNSAPAIQNVQALPSQNVSEGTFTNVTIFFQANDTDGASDLNNDTARIEFTRSGETTRSSTTCLPNNQSGTTITYNCSISMFYYDGAGDWTINASVDDKSNVTTSNSSTTFTYNLFTGMVLSPGALLWPELRTGNTSVGSSNDPVIINNTGNDAFLDLNVTSYDLKGESFPEEYIYAGNFSVNNISQGCLGNTMANASSFNITNVSLGRGNNSLLYFNSSSGQDELFFCIISLNPELRPQAYSAHTDFAWEIRIVLAFVAIPRKKKKEGEKKKIDDDKLLDMISLLVDELKEKHRLNKEEVMNVIIKQVRKKYKINRSEILELSEVKKISIPATIFSEKIGILESLVKYLKENLEMTYKEISVELERDERTIWTAYKKATEKQKEKIIEKETEVLLPMSIFKNKNLTTLEAIIIYLKEKGMKFSEIGEILERDQRNVWTIYSRAKKKYGR